MSIVTILERSLLRRLSTLALAVSCAVILVGPGIALAADVWTPQPANARYGLNGIAFSDTTHGWAVGNDSTIVSTKNGGVTWTAQHGPMPSPITLHSVAFANVNDGWAVGEAGTIISTTNGGKTWNYQGRSATSFDLYGVAFADASHGCAVGDYGTVLFTSNGGSTWTPGTLPSGDDGAELRGVACVNSAFFYAVGHGGAIFASANGGSSWIRETSPTNHDLNAISACPNDSVFSPSLWIAGDDGTIVARINGSSTWATQNSGTGMPLDAVAFANTSDGWAVGTWGTILKTTDGGVHWTKQNSWTKTRELAGVCVVDASHAWATDGDSVVAHNAPAGTYSTATKLSAPSSVKVNTALKLGGTVSPSVALGTVKIVKTRLVGKRWKSAGSATVPLANSAFSYTFKPTVKGSWRLVATYSGKVIGAPTFRSSTSSARTLKVK